MLRLARFGSLAVLWAASAASADPAFTIYEAAGANAAAVSSTRDAFRAAVGGGTVAGANGSFGGLRREINWDGVPEARSDPNALPGDFFNTTSPRGVVLSTPGTGFLVSANAGGSTPTLFGFANDFQTFSAQKLFTAVNSNTIDVQFFVHGTSLLASTSAFGLFFVDVEVAGSTSLAFYDANGALIWSHDALVGGNQGLSFLGATVSGGAISRVRITSGSNTIVSNGVLGNPNDDVVVMDDFLYAEPLQTTITAVPEPTTTALLAVGLLALIGARRYRAGSARGHRRA